jgi:capsule polysaccharide export protein KpsE/RkpR
MIEAVGTLRARIAASEVELQAARSFATEQNPDIILQERQVAAWREQLANLERQQTSGEGDPVVATNKMPAAALEYVGRYREVKYREAIFELMAKQFEAAKLDEAKEAAIIQVVDPAVEPDRKSSPKRVFIVICATMGGFVLALFWALFSESLRSARKDPKRREQLDALARSFGRA